jgi:hypothetical protein
LIVVWLTFSTGIDGPIRSAHCNLARVSMPAIPQFYPAFAPTTLRQDSAAPHPHGLPEKVGECFSTRGSNCISAVMTTIFICDKSRIRHHDALFETIESHTISLAYPSEHGAYHNRQSTYNSRLWRQCGSIYGLVSERLSNLTARHTSRD